MAWATHNPKNVNAPAPHTTSTIITPTSPRLRPNIAITIAAMPEMPHNTAITNRRSIRSDNRPAGH